MRSIVLKSSCLLEISRGRQPPRESRGALNSSRQFELESVISSRTQRKIQPYYSHRNLLVCISLLLVASNSSYATYQQQQQTESHYHVTAETTKDSHSLPKPTSAKASAVEQVETYDLFKRLFDQQPHRLFKRRSPETVYTKQQDSSKSAPNSRLNGANSTADYGNVSNSKCQPSSTQSEANVNDHQQQQQQHESYYQSFGHAQTHVSGFVKPTFYTLRLKVDPTKRKFSGQLMITLDVVASQSATDKSDTESTTSQGQSDSGGGSRDSRTGELGHRYISLHSGGNIYIKKAFYVFTSRNTQIPATRIERNVDQEILTLDFHPNVITSGQGLLLLVYSGLVNETDSHGLFVHRYQKGARKWPISGSGAKQTSILNNLPLAVTNSTSQQQPVGAQVQPDDQGLATHMEPTFARRLFPSWDEPFLKARFNLIVVLPFRGYVSISNMPIKRKSISVSCSGEPLQEIEFHTTPTMSTYLLTLVIGRFEHIESITLNNCRVRAYFYANQSISQPPLSESSNQLAASQQSLSNSSSSSAISFGFNANSPLDDPQQFSNTSQQQPNVAVAVNHRRRAAQMALDLAVKTFDRLETLLGVKYPLAKFDMIALRDFNSGGMENWGASIFHENYLLCDNASQADIRVNGGSNRPKRLVVPLVVAHEIAHQWFGNLLTSYSWTYLWLNEGFAQLLMYDIADSLFPHENYWHIFMEDSRNSAMHEDELITTSRVLEYTATSDADQLALFDQLTYNKGAMMVRMLEVLLGRRQLFAGLQHYLLKHSYDSVTSHDLFQALEESTGRADRQLESHMHSWLHQDGYPMVSVRVFEEFSHWRLEISQERFTLMPAKALLDAANNESQAIHWASWTWSIPVVVSSELNPTPSLEEPLLGGEINSIQSTSSPTTINVAGKIIDYAQQRSRITSSGSRASITPAQLPPASFLLPQEPATTVLLPKSITGSWFKLNFNGTGYYRVFYESVPTPTTSTDSRNQQNSSANRQTKSSTTVDMLALLESAVRTKSMCVIDRLNLVDDLFALVQAGKHSTSEYLRYVMVAYSEETELVVLRSIFNSLARIKALVSNGAQKSNILLDRYVQKYLNLVSNNYDATYINISSDRSSSPLVKRGDRLLGSPTNRQLVADQLTASQNISMSAAGNPVSKELEDLIGFTRSLFNDQHFQRKAADLFSRHFRQQQQLGPNRPSSPISAASPLEAMDREMRASIYSSAAHLMDARDSQVSASELFLGRSAPNSATTDPTLPSSTAQQATNGYVTSSTTTRQPIMGAHSWLSSIFVPAPQSSSDKIASSSVPSLSSGEQQDVFLKLLGAYETSESSGERFALSSALGSAQWPNKQLMLLNLTLHHNYFRPQDAQSLLDSMARTKLGRQNIWSTLIAHSKTLESRQLLSPFLKSLGHGLVESPEAPGEIETQLRRLYQMHGDQEKLIVQTLELVRINSLWFHRDHESIARYLESVNATGEN